jgi:hypothetical protein
MCDGGLGAIGMGTNADLTRSGSGVLDYDITTNPSFYQGFTQNAGLSTYYCYATSNGGDNGKGGQILMSVLEDPATLNTNSGTGTNNSGNRNIVINGSNSQISAWPFIQAMNFSSSMDTTYGSEEVSVEWGNARDYSISLDRTIYPASATVHVTVEDPGLNYDPTSADVWIMDAANETLYFWNNGSEGDEEDKLIQKTLVLTFQVTLFPKMEVKTMLSQQRIWDMSVATIVLCL